MTMRRRPSSWLALLGFGGACAAAALVGAAVTRRNLGWYRTLKKPPFQPSERVFGPVWSALYALMSASAWRVWKSPDSPARSRALGLWGGQLVANAAWSPLFFGAHRPRAALADLGLLTGTAAAYAREAGVVDRAAGWMMAPYLVWCGFAGLLNEEIVRRNPRLRG